MAAFARFCAFGCHLLSGRSVQAHLLARCAALERRDTTRHDLLLIADMGHKTLFCACLTEKKRTAVRHLPIAGCGGAVITALCALSANTGLFAFAAASLVGVASVSRVHDRYSAVLYFAFSDAGLAPGPLAFCAHLNMLYVIDVKERCIKQLEGAVRSSLVPSFFFACWRVICN
jgi:hypothetical protein